MNDTEIYFKKIMLRMARGRNEALKKYGLTGSQMDVLEYLSDHREEKCTVSHIARSFDVKHTSVLHVLKILEAKEFICRETAETEVRSRNIYLTEKAERMLSVKKEALQKMDEQILADFSREEREQLAAYLRRIYANLEQICVESQEVD